jgi:hypothetical protein
VLFASDYAGIEFVPGATLTLTATFSDGTSATAATTVSVTATGTQIVNVAAQANGGVASASSTYGAAFSVSAVNDGDRKGVNWGGGGGWNDATAGAFPDWVQVTFNGAKTITEIDVFALQDNYGSPVDPTQAMTFSLYGITNFQVQYWTGSAWAAVPGGNIAGNSVVWRRLTFPALTTNRIQVIVTGALSSYSRIVEIEAWGN